MTYWCLLLSFLAGSLCDLEIFPPCFHFCLVRSLTVSRDTCFTTTMASATSHYWADCPASLQPNRTDCLFGSLWRFQETWYWGESFHFSAHVDWHWTVSELLTTAAHNSIPTEILCLAFSDPRLPLRAPAHCCAVKSHASVVEEHHLQIEQFFVMALSF